MEDDEPKVTHGLFKGSLSVSAFPRQWTQTDLDQVFNFIEASGNTVTDLVRIAHRLATMDRRSHNRFLEFIHSSPIRIRLFDLMYFRGIPMIGPSPVRPIYTGSSPWVVVDSRTGVVYKWNPKAPCRCTNCTCSTRVEARTLVQAFHADGTPFPERDIPLPENMSMDTRDHINLLEHANVVLLSEDGKSLVVIYPCKHPEGQASFYHKHIIMFTWDPSSRALPGAAGALVPVTQTPHIPVGMVRSIVEETTRNSGGAWRLTHYFNFPPEGETLTTRDVYAVFNGDHLYVLGGGAASVIFRYQHIGSYSRYHGHEAPPVTKSQYTTPTPNPNAGPWTGKTVGLMFDRVDQRCLLVRELSATAHPKIIELHVVAPQAPVVVVWRCILAPYDSFIGVFDAQNGRQPLLLTMDAFKVSAQAITFSEELTPVDNPPGQNRQVLRNIMYAHNGGHLRWAAMGGYGGVLCEYSSHYDMHDNQIDVCNIVTPNRFQWPAQVR